MLKWLHKSPARCVWRWKPHELSQRLGEPSRGPACPAGMKSYRSASETKTTLAKSLAPEDVRVGQYVAVLRVTYEVPSYVWDGCDSFGERNELVRLAMVPDEPAEPLKVKAVCLPFVLVRSSSGHVRGLDVRRFHLARLDDTYARTAWKASKPKKSKQSNSRQKRRNKR